MTYRLSLIVLCCVFELGSHRVLADSAKSGDSSAVNTGSTLEEVVVTARKREENLQQVPVSVTAVSASEIANRSAVSLADVALSAANVSFNTETQNGGASALVFIRGVGQSDALLTNDPGVGVYVDGVYLGRMQGLNLGLMDVQQVEILRGPQGTLFGRNTIGGAINVVTTKPDVEADNVSGKTDFVFGNFARADATAQLNLPIVKDLFAVTLAGTSRHEAGYGYSLASGADLSNVNNTAGRISALLKPNDQLDVELSVDANFDHDHSPLYKLVAVNTQAPLVHLYNSLSSPGLTSAFITNSFYTNYAAPAPDYSHDQTEGGALTVTWHPGPIDVKSISAYRINRISYGQAIDAADPSTSAETERMSQHQFSQELQFNGLSFGGRLNWVSGLYYFKEQAQDFTYFDVYPQLYQLAGLDIASNKLLPINNASYAAYGQGTFAIRDNLHLTIGGRLSYDQKTGSVYSTSGVLGTVLIPYTTKSLSSDKFTPRVSLESQWTPNLMTYISAASGYKVGGFNGRAGAQDEFTEYNPETVWTYEVGLRSDWLERRLRVNASLYYSNYQDIQVNVTAATVGGADASTIQNAAGAKIQGGELEIQAIPIDDLKVTAQIGLTDAQYTKIQAGVPFTIGDHFQDTPRWMSSLSGEYFVPVDNGKSMGGRLDFVYRTTTYHEAANTPASTQGSYGLLNGRLILKSVQDKWSVAVFATNILNKQYFTGAVDVSSSLGIAVVNPAPPRQGGVEVSYRF